MSSYNHYHRSTNGSDVTVVDGGGKEGTFITFNNKDQGLEGFTITNFASCMCEE